MKKLEGKVAVITGGSTGIGLSTAKRFVEEGAHVFITGRRQGELDQAVQSIGRNVTGVQGDVAKLEDLNRLYRTVKETKGGLDILFANAGILDVASLEQVTEAHYDNLFDINVKGLLFSVQKALPLLRDGGSIILNASVADCKALEFYSVYCATKAAVRSFARGWTLELNKRNIRVNVVSPGPIETPIADHFNRTPEETEEMKQRLISMVPLGRMGDADEVAKAVSFLASDESSFITGIELCVDGGLAQI